MKHRFRNDDADKYNIGRTCKHQTDTDQQINKDTQSRSQEQEVAYLR